MGSSAFFQFWLIASTPGERAMRAFTALIVVAVLSGYAPAQEKKGKGLDLKNLPAAVRATIQANLKGGEIRNISKEKEDDVVQYQVESVL
jgi:hypothetical protein